MVNNGDYFFTLLSCKQTRQQQILSLRRVSTTTHIRCHWSTDLRDVTYKPSTSLKNQDIGLKTKHCRYIMCMNCAAGAWFLNQDLVFSELVLGLQVSGETGESAQLLSTHHHYHWSTDNTVVRVHWPARRIMRIACRYLLHSLIFPHSVHIFKDFEC